MRKRIVVIGGGAAGCMAAIAAASCGGAVTLLEPNERLGKKLNITGKGRCNVTNDCPADEFLRHIPGNGRFLYGAIYRFTPQDTMTFFRRAGVALKVERGNRVFPVSDSAFDVSAALERQLRDNGVQISRDRAQALVIEEGRVTAVKGTGQTYGAECVILATGGVSYPATGSTGDGYRLAAAAGHTVVPPRGSLVPLESDDNDCIRLQGLTLKNVAVSVSDSKGKTVYRDMGEMLFTHFGVSGPLILSASAHLRNWERERYTLHIDMKPALDGQKLAERILRDIAAAPNRETGSLLAGLMPRSMADVLCRRLGWTGTEKLHSLRREQRRELTTLLKDFTVPLTRPRPVEEAIITAGGVCVSEVQPNTMASKLVSGLYFAGEILDVDGYTGGFNLQIAWATGHLAGVSAAQE